MFAKITIKIVMHTLCFGIYEFFFEEISVHYEVLNEDASGEPIVFLHGWEGSGKSFEFFAENLSLTRPFVLLDFPPFGESSMLSTPWTVQKYAQMVICLLQSLGHSKFSIVAHSFGGRVALNLASNEGKIVSKMVLTGCAGIKKRSFEKWCKVKFFKFLKFLAKLKLFKKSSLKKMGSEDYKKLNDTMKKTFVNIVTYDQKAEIKKVTCPTLLFWGENDTQTPFYFTKYFKKHIKDCEVVKTNGTHFAYIESASLFLKILQDFFSQD